MSAENTARTVRQVDDLDSVRALRRVHYRSAKQNPTRRFHALFDKLVRNDVIGRTSVNVTANPKHLFRACPTCPELTSAVVPGLDGSTPCAELWEELTRIIR